jgi:hypothetical protein
MEWITQYMHSGIGLIKFGVLMHKECAVRIKKADPKYCIVFVEIRESLSEHQVTAGWHGIIL